MCWPGLGISSFCFETGKTVRRLQVCHASRNNRPPLFTFLSVSWTFLTSKLCPIVDAHKLCAHHMTDWGKWLSFKNGHAYAADFDHVHGGFHYAAKFAFFKQNQRAFTKTVFEADTIPFSSKWYLLHTLGLLCLFVLLNFKKRNLNNHH